MARLELVMANTVRVFVLLACAPFAMVASGGQSSAPTFRVQSIDATESETVAVADLNNDRRPDLISAENWYEAPAWTKRPLRTINRASGYVDDFSDLPVDVDGDGYLDLVQIGYFARRLEWLKNPGPAGGAWPVNLIDAIGPTEFAFLVDLTNDGKALELLPQFTRAANQPAAWYEVQNGKWIKHVVSAAKFFGHGIGAGDLNRDGRADIVTPTGWLEAPADVRAPGDWTFHETNWSQQGLACAADAAGPTRAAPMAEYGYMHVRDVNGDGRADILTTMGHSCGVLWFEQGADGGWTRHVIDDTWSAAHASTIVDLNGDGRPDFVTGKRALIHSDAAPTERDRLVMYWYELPAARTGRERGDWVRHVIQEGGRMGGGLQIAVADIDGDGDLDVVSAGKTGLFAAENLTKSAGQPSRDDSAHLTNAMPVRTP
jgi:hypothetical protein